MTTATRRAGRSHLTVPALRCTYAVGLFVLALWFGSPVDTGSPRIDPDFYARMAEHFGSVDQAPFSYRFLIPQLAGALPGPTQLGFIVVGVLSVVLAGWACNRTLEHHGYVGWPAELVVLVSPIPWAFVHQPIGTDTFALAVVALGLLLIVRGNWVALSTLLFVGVLGRETVIALAASAAVVATSRFGWRRGCALAGILSLPALVALVAIRTTPVLYGRALPGRLQLPDEIITWRTLHDGGLAAALLGAAAFSLGPLWVPAIRAIRRAPDHPMVALTWPVLLLSLSTVLFASDWSRLAASGVVAAAILASISSTRSGMVVVAASLASCSIVAEVWRGGLVAPLVAAAIAAVGSYAAIAPDPRTMSSTPVTSGGRRG